MTSSSSGPTRAFVRVDATVVHKRPVWAPAEEREEFLREAEQLATEATGAQGLRNVVWRVVERDSHLYGVLYGERCD
jgi:hypothetical protein